MFFYIFEEQNQKTCKLLLLFLKFPFVHLYLLLSLNISVQYLHRYDAKMHLKSLRDDIFAHPNHVLTPQTASV